VRGSQRLQAPRQRLLSGVETVTQEDSEGHCNPYSTLSSPGNLVFFLNDPSFFVGHAAKPVNQLINFAAAPGDAALQAATT
jgi:hypothetical protein